MSVGGPLREQLDRIQRIAIVAGGLGLAVCVAGALFNPGLFYPGYLVAYLFWIGLALGCVAITMLHHLVGGTWGLPIRRPMEAGAFTLVPLAALFVPLIFGLHILYPWANPSTVAADVSIRHKSTYLAVTPFLIRVAADFVFWIICAWLLNRWSLAQDSTEDTGPSRKLQTLSGPGLALIFLTASFAAIDWAMSIEPDWYSTIYGPMLITGWALETFAAMIFIANLLANYEPIATVATPGRLHDLGNLMLAFVMLWAYMAFSQFLIIWCGNLAKEIPWYLRRTQGGWQWVVLALIVFHFFLPFFCLLFRDVKRQGRLLMRVALAVIVIHWINLLWLVLPPFTGTKPLRVWPAVVLALAATIGIGGVWATVFLAHLKGRPLVPLHDPGINPALESSEGNAP